MDNNYIIELSDITYPCLICSHQIEKEDISYHKVLHQTYATCSPSPKFEKYILANLCIVCVTLSIIRHRYCVSCYQARYKLHNLENLITYS